MKYEEIIHHEHYRPKHHPRMSRAMRAAQFSPFAALTGYDKTIRRVVESVELRSKKVVSMTDLDGKDEVYIEEESEIDGNNVDNFEERDYEMGDVGGGNLRR